ncbi:hypothetical protein ILYODFUR_019058 [Ilyodon furcidens]|uniref:Uncharacterized protein n=1 Tax=Ilyodon furcidens TaxID=33524 RepID=A0ABV0UUR4_9TELE
MDMQHYSSIWCLSSGTQFSKIIGKNVQKRLKMNSSNGDVLTPRCHSLLQFSKSKVLSCYPLQDTFGSLSSLSYYSSGYFKSFNFCSDCRYEQVWMNSYFIKL